MTESRANLAHWLAGVAAPVALVVVSVVLLGTLAAATVLDSMAERERYGLFAAGVGCWVVGIASGVLANGRPATRVPWRRA